MTNKPKIRVIDGGMGEKLIRKIFKLLISPTENKDEIARLMAILERRGDLSSIRGGQENPSDPDNKEKGVGK